MKCALYHKIDFSVTGEMPESLTRIQTLTGKKIVFENVDLCDLEQLRTAAKKVIFFQSRNLYSLLYCVVSITQPQCIFFQFTFDCVLHAAAYKSVAESCAQPLMYYGNNVIGSYNLLKVRLVYF